MGQVCRPFGVYSKQSYRVVELWPVQFSETVSLTRLSRALLKNDFHFCLAKVLAVRNVVFHFSSWFRQKFCKNSTTYIVDTSVVILNIRTTKRYENLINVDYGVTNQLIFWKMDQNSGCKVKFIWQKSTSCWHWHSQLKNCGHTNQWMASQARSRAGITSCSCLSWARHIYAKKHTYISCY